MSPCKYLSHGYVGKMWTSFFTNYNHILSSSGKMCLLVVSFCSQRVMTIFPTVLKSSTTCFSVHSGCGTSDFTCLHTLSTETWGLCKEAHMNEVEIKISCSVSMAADTCVSGTSVLFSFVLLSALTARHSLPLSTITGGCFYVILWFVGILIMYFHVGPEGNTHTFTCTHTQIVVPEAHNLL